jgi:hypothetical protein
LPLPLYAHTALRECIPLVCDEGPERSFIEKPCLVLIVRVFGMQKICIGVGYKQCKLLGRKILIAVDAVADCLGDRRLHPRNHQFYSTVDAPLPDARLLVSFGLPELKAQIDKRRQHRQAAYETAYGRNI